MSTTCRMNPKWNIILLYEKMKRNVFLIIFYLYDDKQKKWNKWEEQFMPFPKVGEIILNVYILLIL